MRRIIWVSVLVLLLLSGCASSTGSGAIQTTTAQPTVTVGASGTPASLPASNIAGLKLPAGFQISVYAQGLSEPRFMIIGPGGALLVANRRAGSVVALLPGSSPLKAARTITLLKNLNDPTSLDMHDGYLYVGEQTSIARVKLGSDLQPGSIEQVITDLPAGGQHSTRTVLIGSDNRIYVAVGSDCNVCQEANPHRAAVWVYNLDGSNGHLFAKGLRNAVGLATNPWNQQIWATNNGRDLLGDNTPPETVYSLVGQGDYGWPRCHAGTIPDPQFGKSSNACQGVQQPLVNMQAHSAPLGLAFYPRGETQFPAQYRDSLYIAFHGSWNRSIPTGYKVVHVPLKDGKVAGPAEDFVTGWLKSSGSSTGRPAGVTFAPDGTLFVSDDTHGAIYHIWYRG